MEVLGRSFMEIHFRPLHWNRTSMPVGICFRWDSNADIQVESATKVLSSRVWVGRSKWIFVCGSVPLLLDWDREQEEWKCT